MGSVVAPVPGRYFGLPIPPHVERNYIISGLTQDTNGSPLGNSVVKLFLTATDTLVAQTVSDALGNYSFVVDKALRYYAVSYKAAGPDVYGTTLNTLTGT